MKNTNDDPHCSIENILQIAAGSLKWTSCIVLLWISCVFSLRFVRSAELGDQQVGVNWMFSISSQRHCRAAVDLFWWILLRFCVLRC
jgi:hypothetical protein